jgi:hypothetical protein
MWIRLHGFFWALSSLAFRPSLLVKDRGTSKGLRAPGLERCVWLLALLAGGL